MKTLLRTLLVDDEPPARTRLARKLAGFADFSIVGEAGDGVEALGKIEALRPDVVFLDIEMPELDGLGVARSLGGAGPQIVFVTAYDAYALKAFDANAIDYLVKPVAESRLLRTVERLRRGRPAAAPDLDRLPPSRAAIKCGNKYVVIDPQRISAILARDHYAAVLVDGKEYLIEDSLDAVAQRFRSADLIKIHRRGIINLRALAELVHEDDRKYLAVLNDAAKTRVPVSREKLDDVKRALGL